MGFFKDFQRGLQTKKPAAPPTPNSPQREPEPVTPSSSKAGNYKGRHFTKYVDEVKALEKAGRQDEAVVLLLHLVEATEAESEAEGLGVAPWYYERLAIIYRKQHRLEDEVEILKRFVEQKHAPGASPPKLLRRLHKLQGAGTTSSEPELTVPEPGPRAGAPFPGPAPARDNAGPFDGRKARRAEATGADFLAIDFETACGSRASACSVGYAKFCDGQLVETGETLISPGLKASEWDAFNMSIHGISPEDVVGAPSFAEAWQMIQQKHRDVPLVAHNAAFDMSVIRAELSRAGHVPDTPLQYTCSAALARLAWPEMVSVSLSVVTDRLGIDLDHHDAKSDAIASGSVAIQAAQTLQCTTIGDALREARIDWSWINADLTWDTGHRVLRATDFEPAEDCDPTHPLYGKTVVFTGKLQSMTRRDAFGMLSKVGGAPGNGVTRRTSILVVGEQDLARLAAGDTTSSKMKKAAELRATGLNIEIIDEAEFRQRL